MAPPQLNTTAANSPSPPPLLSPTGKPTHLQPLETSSAWHGSSQGSLPTTPKSNLGPQGVAVTRLGSTASLRYSASDISVASLSQTLQPQHQQQQQQADDDNIKVVVRVRPMFPAEVAKGATNVITVAEDCSSLQVVVPGPGGATMQRDFSFHACLGPEVSQADVMDLCGIHQLLDAALAGYHVTIFAYGQTGSGKTFSMSGHEDVISDESYNGHDKDGIISRAMQYLFHQVNTKRDAKYTLKASYLEIYNEGVYDLVHFSPKAKSLPVKWDASYGFYVQGLKVVPCSQQRTMMEVIRTGMKHRKVGSHQLNMESSRSHAIFTVYCDATPTDPSSYDYGTIRYGKVSFVDLAGSERVKDSRSEGTMLKETININKSLSVLGKVILALAEQGTAGTTAHVPYRDSKLTKLLMDSLGGSALTLMVACCSPSSLQVEETLSTLSYATRTKNIHNRPTVQYDPREAQISLLRREIELLRQENTLLKEQLRTGTGTGSLQGSLPTTPDGSPHLSGKRKVPPLPAGISMGSPGSSRGTSPSPRTLNSSPSPQPPGADAGAAQRGRISPGMQSHMHSLRQGAGSPAGSGPGDQHLRTSANELDLRANAARHAAAAAAGGSSPGGGTLTNQELLRRLRDTQALLIKFSEENSRLSTDNQMLQAGRNALGAEHANVLDEIDLLRGKLSQLESNVLAAAAASSSASGSATPGAGGSIATAAGSGPAAAGRKQSAAAAGGSAGGVLDLRSLLQSLGLGEEVVGGLTEMGVGPLGAEPEPEQQQQQDQQLQPQAWKQQQQHAGSQAEQGPGRSVRSASLLQANSSSRSTSSIASVMAGAAVAAAGDTPQGRAALGSIQSAARSRQLPLSAGSRGPAAAQADAAAPPRSGSPAGGMLAALTRSVNRTPLLNKAAALEPKDDSIIVGDAAGLAVLLGGKAAAAKKGGEKS